MIAIVNGLVQLPSGERMERGTILIREGKIAEVGPFVSIPAQAEVIDAEGRLVTPGLIDVHTHLGIDEEGVGWEGDDYNETSEPVTPHLRALDGINPYDRGFHDAAAAGITAVQVLPGSANVIGGLSCCLKIKPGHSVDEMLIAHPAGLKVAFGENPKKFHGQQKGPKTRMAIAGLLREQLTLAQNYRRKRRKQAEADIDLRMEALVRVLDGEIPLRAHVHRADDILTAIRIAREFDVQMSIEHATEGHRIADHLRRCGFFAAVGPTLSARSKVELGGMDWEIYHVFEQNRIPFSITTDHPVVPIQHLVTCAGLAVQAGLSEQAAWQALTLQPARHLGLSDRLGSIERGKDADLVIWSERTLRHFIRPIMTMVEGKVIYNQDSPGG